MTVVIATTMSPLFEVAAAGPVLPHMSLPRTHKSDSRREYSGVDHTRNPAWSFNPHICKHCLTCPLATDPRERTRGWTDEGWEAFAETRQTKILRLLDP